MTTHVEIHSPSRVLPVIGGPVTAIWQVKCANGVFAFRVFRADQAMAAQRDVTAMRAAGAGGLLVPTVIASGVHVGRPAQL